MIIIIALILLFGLFFFLKKHAGTAILASFAGAIVYDTVIDFFANLHKMTNIPLDIIENSAFAILVIVVPLLVYIFSKRSWSPVFIRVISSAVFVITILTLSSGLISGVFPLDSLGSSILDFIAKNRGLISTIGIVVAYFDVLLPHKDYS